MLEFVGSGILGSLVGGLFRLAPELLKFFGKKEDNAHEYKMFELQTKLEAMRGDVKVEEKYVDFSIAQLNATQAAFEEQSKTATSSYKWVAALNALVRPMITYFLFGMYIAVKATFIYFGLDTGIPWKEVLLNSWTPDDFAMLNGILMFWFVSRSVQKYERRI